MELWRFLLQDILLNLECVNYCRHLALRILGLKYNSTLTPYTTNGKTQLLINETVNPQKLHP